MPISYELSEAKLAVSAVRVGRTSVLLKKPKSALEDAPGWLRDFVVSHWHK